MVSFTYFLESCQLGYGRVQLTIWFVQRDYWTFYQEPWELTYFDAKRMWIEVQWELKGESTLSKNQASTQNAIPIMLPHGKYNQFVQFQWREKKALGHVSRVSVIKHLY